MNDDDLRNVWKAFRRAHGCSIDRMLCDPDLRLGFVSAVRGSVLPGGQEFVILWSLLKLRKGKGL